MIAPIIDAAYDYEGTRVGKVSVRRRRKGKVAFAPTAPMGRYLSQPLGVACADLEAIRSFLCSCRYVSDPDQFGKDDYWMPPEDFEQRRRGDCEDFALWVWRQLLLIGYEARFVIGRSGRYGEGHAWLTLEIAGRRCLLEPQARVFGMHLPRLSAVRYRPEVSVRWDGARIEYFEHEDREFRPAAREALGLVLEWTRFYSRLALVVAWRLPRVALRRLRRRPRGA